MTGVYAHAVQTLSPGDVISRAFAIYRDQIGVLLPTALLVFALFLLPLSRPWPGRHEPRRTKK